MRFFKSALGLHLLILIGVFLGVAITNFPYGSFLSGWDNLHPEFNFLLNFKRGIFAVWQENQGLGTYGGHGYGATLPHTLILFLLSIILPDMYLRGVFTFLCLFVGILGVFFLTNKILHSKEESVRLKSALLAGLFYLLNFGTVQNFYIQLEAFIVHFALLPWLFLTLITYLEHSSRKNLLIFAFITLASSIQGFIPPLFLVYMILLGIFLFAYIVERITLDRIKRAIFIVVLTLFINSYWFLPVLNFALTRSDTYLNAYNNLSSTEDFILKNQKYGNISDITILKGFISEAIDSSESGSIFYIFSTWLTHINTNIVKILGFLFFSIAVLGLITLLKLKKNYFSYAVIICFILIFSLLATDTAPFSYISNILAQVPILKQAFRVAFTKFSISLSLFYSIGFGVGCFALISLISHILKENYRHFSAVSISLLIGTTLIYFSLPIFSGNFLYQRTKLTIPSMYFEMFKFFRSQDPKTRIANLPQGWNWGWSVYNWGYSGSGFLWYGIEQPIMDRAFDVWGKYNENYYWEITYAIYSENFPLFEKVLDKYQVNWIVLDKNIVPYLNSRGYIYSSKFENYLNNAGKFKLVKKIISNERGVQNIMIYQVNLAKLVDQFKGLIPMQTLKNIGPSYHFTNNDQAYDQYGIYYTDSTKPYEIYYPYRSLFFNKKTDSTSFGDLPIKIEDSDSDFRFISQLSSNVLSYGLNIPYNQTIEADKVKIETEKSNFIVTVKKEEGENSYSSSSDPFFLNHTASNCKSSSQQGDEFTQAIRDGFLEFTSLNSENCYTIILPNLAHRYSYLLQIANTHTAGKRLQFALINEDSKKSDVEYPLTSSNSKDTAYVIIPPMKYYGLGYSLLFNNISIGNKKSINDLISVNLQPIPYNLLTGISLANPVSNNSNERIYVYYQSFDPGWKLYIVDRDSIPASLLPSVFGQQIKDHVLINNWANGWRIGNDELRTANYELIIVYWPQYLQYLGFILVIGTISWVSLRGKTGKKRESESLPNSPTPISPFNNGHY